MDEELLPCPFCGKRQPELLSASFGNPEWVYFSCRACAAASGASIDVGAAIAAWNRRASAPEGGVGELVDALEPFAKAAARMDGERRRRFGNNALLIVVGALNEIAETRVFMGDLRQASTALATYRSTRPAEPAVSAEAVEKAREALEKLCDRDASYHGPEVRIAFGSHGEAVGAMCEARRALAALGGRE